MTYKNATLAGMNIPSRDLRNNTATVLKRVQAGEEIVVTVRGNPVAQLISPRLSGKRPLTSSEFVEIIQKYQADSGLRKDLEYLENETSDEILIQ